MKIVVMSDSHGRVGDLIDIGFAHKNADAFLFLGDGWRDFEDFKSVFDTKECVSVKGNCDLGCDENEQRIVIFGGKKILMAHGHTHGVKYSIEGMVAAAKREGCDIMLYGHTHTAHEEYRDGLYILNPGSVGRPSSGKKSYGVIEIVNSGIVIGIAEIK